MGLLAITNRTGSRLPPGARKAMESAAAAALAAGRGPSPSRARIDLTITSDEHLRELSREYLGHDHYTDVMSFSQVERAADGDPEMLDKPRGRQLLGDIVVSLDRAREQAAEIGHPVSDELALLVAHGVLHLLGFSDDTAEAQAQMRRLEEQALAAAGIRA